MAAVAGILAAASVTGTVPVAALPVGAATLALATITVVGWRRLDRNRAALAGVFRGSSAAHLVTDAAGRAVYANAAFRRMCRAVGAAPTTLLERLSGDDPATLAELRRLGDAARAGAAAEANLALRAAAGKVEQLLVRAGPLAGWPGHVNWRIDSAALDRAHERIAEDEQARLMRFMGDAPIGFYAVDGSGRFLFVNAALAQWLDVEPSDLAGSDRRLHEMLADPAEGGAPYDLLGSAPGQALGEVVLRGLKGRRFQAAVAQSLVNGGDGRVVGARAIVRDLSPERQGQEALRRSEERFQRFFEDAPIGIVLVDDGCRLAECNRTFLAMIGGGLSEAAARPIVDLVLPAERATVARRLADVLAGADLASPLQVHLSGPRGVVAQLYARRLGGAAGGGLMLHFIDMTEQKNLEVQFAQSQKMQAVGQLAGGVAHDFNNLLTAMIGFCDLLLLRHKPGDQSFSDIMQIKQNANRAANLVRQLLAFSRQQTLQPRVLDVTDVLAELAHLLRRLIGENIELRMIHGRELGLVKVDQGQLEQVIINLAVNARDAMPGTGRLAILTGNHSVDAPARRGDEEMPVGDYIFIEVIDTGVGIPAENLARIFEPFFSTKEVGSGTGLGLSTVYGIVRQTGGFVFVDSMHGQGAKFTIFLPRYDDAAEPAARTAEEVRERLSTDLTGAGTILLVEDEDAVRVFSARALRNKGYHVLEAKSGEAALAMLESEGSRADLLISDVVMPHMDGPTLIKRVRASRPDLKVIFISGYTEDRFRDHLDAGSHIHFLAKPFSLKQLAAKVKEVMRAAA